MEIRRSNLLALTTVLLIYAGCVEAFVSPHEQCRAIWTHRALDSRKLVEGETSDDPLEATTSVQQQQHDGFSRRSFLRDSLSATVLLFSAAAAASEPANAASTTMEQSSAGILDGVITKPANPFVQLETVGMVPKAYFEENRSIYGFTERILDGDTIRVRHVPGYSFTNQTPEPLAKRGIADDTLLIRLYGVDCPEIAKNKNQTTQPFGEEAKQFTSDLVYHQMVKVTFLRRDRYGRAIAMVETLPSGGYLLSGLPGLGTRDLTLELAREGLAELYKGGGAEYYTKKDEIRAAIREAQKSKRGIWSLGDDRVSAAEQKRLLRSGEGQDPAATFTN